MANIQKIYSDIDFTFTKKPVVGDIALSYDAQSVIRSIRNLIQTKKYERPFNPQLDSKVNSVLFDLMTLNNESLLESEITRIVGTFEPRANMKTVKVSSDPEKNAYYVTLSFYIENSTTETVVTLLLERNR